MGQTVYFTLLIDPIKTNHSWIGKYTVRPMDPMGLNKLATSINLAWNFKHGITRSTHLRIRGPIAISSSDVSC